MDLLDFQRRDSAQIPLDSGIAEHTLHGEIEKVVYTSEDSSYSVLRVKDKQGVLHCVVGPIAGGYPGQSITVAGKWEIHKEHGRQLRATSYEFTLPSTLEGIARYLASGLIKGIGEKYAQAIVDTFGEDTLYILDHASVRLKEVPGLGKKRIADIRKSWKGHAERRNIQIYMQSLGISLTYFNKIYKLYGDGSATILKENPYRLASEVTGIGFLMADRIASATGIGKDDPKRLVAGVTYGLSQIRLAGHVCMPRTQFLRMLSELLDIPEGKAELALDDAKFALSASEERSAEGDPMIYEPGLLRCENELPVLLGRISRQNRHYGQYLNRIPAPEQSKFSEEQLSAVKTVCGHSLSIITGGPGVGKTTVVAEIVRRARLARLKVVLAAPTGRAAKRLTETTGCQAYTIHRMLKWDPPNGQFYHNRNNPLPYHLYVIDETSMLDITIAVALFRAIRPGSAVVIVGDPDQLPSVGPGNILNDLIFSRCFPVTRLTRIFRQGEGSGIIRAAHAVNRGELPMLPDPEKRAELSDFYWIERDDPDEVASLIEQFVCSRIPRRFHVNPIRDIQVLCPMNRGVVGTHSMNERLQEMLNPATSDKQAFRSGERIFRIGDKLMQISNNYEKSVFNGDMGFLAQVDHAQNTFTVQFDTGPVRYDFPDSDQLTLAYAVTVHKSQGSEFPVVVMPLLSQHYMMLQRNLLYTGMTRAKKLMILIGSKKAVSMAVRNAVREPRYSLLLEKLIRALGERKQNAQDK